MSIRENIELFYDLDLEKYQRVLKEEFNAESHASQQGAFSIDGLPFYTPKDQGDHISILGFNKIPLPSSLVEALIQHPELAPDHIVVRWTHEQDLILKSTLRELREVYNRTK